MWKLWFYIFLMVFIILIITIFPLIRSRILYRNNKFIFLILGLLVLPLISFLIYLKIGTSEQLKQYQITQISQVKQNELLAALHHPEKIIDQLKNHLKQSPTK